MRAPTLLCAAVSLFAQPGDPAQVLTRCKEAAREVISKLPKYTCSATVNRSYFKEVRHVGVTCDDIVANRKLGTSKLLKTATDRLRFDVEVADGGYEIFAWPGASRIDSEKIEDMADGGPIGTGPFGPFLIDIFDNAATTFDYRGSKAVRGQRLYEYRFRVPKEASHYKVGVGSAFQFVGFDGTFRADPATGTLASLEIRTAQLPRETESCEATTGVDFQTVRIGQGDYTIPQRSRLYVTGKYGLDSESVTSYSACHEFRGESAVHFGEEPAVAASAGVKPDEKPLSLPPGLPVSLAFETSIDTDVAAAGDPLVARVIKDVADPRSKHGLLAAGTRVTGRILHMEHHLAGGDYFLLTVRFDTLNLVLDHPRQIVDLQKATPCWGSQSHIESKGRLSVGGIFVLPSRNGRFVTPRGCQSDWLTTMPPQ